MFTVQELDLVRQLGVSKKTMRFHRDRILLRGTDFWSKHPKSKILYTEEAARKIINHFIPDEVVASEVVPEPVQQPPAQPAPPELPPGHGIVVRAKFLNKTIIEVMDRPQEPAFFVKVRSSENFLPGMTVRWKQDAPGAMRYLVGNCPRRRGKW